MSISTRSVSYRNVGWLRVNCRRLVHWDETGVLPIAGGLRATRPLNRGRPQPAVKEAAANVAQQCLHPTGHWYEIPNMLRNGVLATLLEQHPQLQYLMLHNIDTLGANVDPQLLGWFLKQKAAMMFEVIPRQSERSRGRSRARERTTAAGGRAGAAIRGSGSGASCYNSATAWMDIDRLLAAFSLTRGELRDEEKVASRVRAIAARMPTYITLKDVRKRWGKGQEDIFPIAQFEKLWGDMTALPDVSCRFAVVSRRRLDSRS